MVRFPHLAHALAGLLLVSSLGAAESPAVKAFSKAMSGEDYVAKKDAIGALASKSAGDDNDVLPLLIGALSDRQAGKLALAALRSRTGLSPNAGSEGGGGYPGYPVNDTAGAWSTWLAARKSALEQEEKIKKLAKEAEDKKKKEEDEKKNGETGEATAGTEGGTGAPAGSGVASKGEAAAADLPSDLGRIDRVVFRNGGSMRCYIMSRHNDPSGNLISIRVVHPDGGGEETLAADLIARLEEDVE